MVLGAQKEIHEQPDSILQTMSGRVNLTGSHKVPLQVHRVQEASIVNLTYL